ncbi:hypothetical protein [Mobilicoccus caccae]|nr:hypothetical protein [Mobilicoccus caccae]
MKRLPHDYPWTSTPAAGLLDRGRFRAHADPLRSLDLQGRRAVVAVGSNAAPAVLAAKLPEARIPLLPAVMTHLAVGHSAHVSLAGYIAAAPYPYPGARTPVMVSWLEAAALAELDATEPNYERVTVSSVGGDLHADTALHPEDVDLYVSRHGVVGTPEPLALTTQERLFAELARVPELSSALEGDVIEVCARLADDPDLRATVTGRLPRWTPDSPETPAADVPG